MVASVWHLRQGQSTSSVSQVEVPTAARARSTLPQIGYADAFVVEVPAAHARTAEQWARAIFDDAPIALRRALITGWSAIGLKLSWTRSERFVLGWRIRRSTPEFVLLGAESHIGMPAELLLTRERDTLLFDTFVRLGSPLARAVWAGVGLVHPPIVRYVLAQGSHRAHDLESGS